MNKVIQLGNLVKKIKHFTNPQRGRVYSIDGICPTLNTCSGGGLEPKVLIIGGENEDSMRKKIR